MKYGLIGEKLSHSFSPEIHKKFGDYSYCLKELKTEELSAFLKQREFKGINVTIPFKEAVIPFLDYLSEEAKQIGAVNTVINENGILKGFNTDYSGLKGLCEREKIDFSNKSVLILGSGGTSKTAFFVAEKSGAKEIKKVSRTKKEGYITYDEISFNEDIVINTTPCGMFPEFKNLPLNLKKFKHLYACVDAVYNPLRTRGELLAKEMGAKAVSGLYMLCLQAYESAKLFGIENLNSVDFVFEEILKEKQNIVLIGMPSSGKTVLGKAVSKKLNREFIDTDELTAQTTGSISDYIIKNGEKKFREKEAEAVRRIFAKTGVVISCGGGTVLDKQNVDYLRQNGKIFYIKRDLEKLETKGRPLSVNLKEMYRLRSSVYEAAADFTVYNNTEIDIAAEKITKEYKK